MQVITEKQAFEKYLSEGYDDVFDFEEYVKYLEKCHVVVIREPE